MEIIKDTINIDWNSITCYVVVIGLIIWFTIKLFSKGFIERWGQKTADLLSKKQETMIEQSVKNKFDSSLAILESSLAKKNIEFGINYTFYNTERSKFCIELYRRLVDLYNAAGTLTGLHFHNSPQDSNWISLPAAQEQYNNALSGLMGYYNYNKILINEDTCNQIISFINQIEDCCKRYLHFYSLYTHVKTSPSNSANAFNEAAHINIREIARLKEDLERLACIFRELIQPAG